ncbi:hypothetical protein BCR34DRAFT_66382 [Clohesyomyces aquaticus]|uniref:Uncharacterized protein n=1 Tax=Clohesyomyces aquaticus TaxID=1231657 RepID=A0A1Y1Z0W3_9PLEO|nr:hypothetical protein BCR34DRAFT_66382 [Clohesyomyces aquaticus]
MGELQLQMAVPGQLCLAPRLSFADPAPPFAARQPGTSNLPHENQPPLQAYAISFSHAFRFPTMVLVIAGDPFAGIDELDESTIAADFVPTPARLSHHRITATRHLRRGHRLLPQQRRQRNILRVQSPLSLRWPFLVLSYRMQETTLTLATNRWSLSGSDASSIPCPSSLAAYRNNPDPTDNPNCSQTECYTSSGWRQGCMLCPGHPIPVRNKQWDN